LPTPAAQTVFSIMIEPDPSGVVNHPANDPWFGTLRATREGQ
jgi:hypothetical protein